MWVGNALQSITGSKSCQDLFEAEHARVPYWIIFSVEAAQQWRFSARQIANIGNDDADTRKAFLKPACFQRTTILQRLGGLFILEANETTKADSLDNNKIGLRKSQKN